MNGTCALCLRNEVEVTKHHLVPRIRHNKKVKREMTTLERNTTVPLCRPCHDQLHAIFTEKQLEREWNTLEKLNGHPGVQKWIDWIQHRHVGARLKTRT